MIHVHELTKQYAGRTAVDRLSFDVEAGEIVGFLGPNGAGKSTTMRILSGYMPPTSGMAMVDGHDVFRESLEVRRKVGYMPEMAPLYHDMRVKEYLHFRAELKGLRGRDLRHRTGEVMDLCAVTDVRRRVIGNLSKGFKQRVALADALHKVTRAVFDRFVQAIQLLTEAGGAHGYVDLQHVYWYADELQLAWPRKPIMQDASASDLEGLDKLAALVVETNLMV